MDDLMIINYVQGHATRPIGGGNRIIVNLCNDLGYWEGEFKLALSERWWLPEMRNNNLRSFYYYEDETLPLGKVQFVEVDPATWVANLIGQQGRNVFHGFRFDAIRKGLRRVAKFAETKNATVHMPRIGTLASEEWHHIAQIINEELLMRRIHVTVYA
jgi:hypothetical protein